MVAIVLVLGLLAASFIGSVADRSARSLSVVSPRSHCPRCGKPIPVYDLVPLVSYILLRGRCRRCGGKIGVEHLLLEIVTPVLYLLLFLRLGLTPELAAALYLVTILISLSLRDIRERAVSLSGIVAVYAGGGGWCVYLALTSHPLIGTLYGFAVVLLLIGASGLIVRLLRRRTPIGLGDLLLIPGIALYLDPLPAIRVLIVASVGGILGWFVLRRLDGSDRTVRIPFVPFVTLGLCVEILVRWHYIS
jgi:leader peptidase (prepilin peptidase)/N-methyltransferase